MRRGELYWADLGPAGRRPVLVVTRTAAIPHLTSVTVAPVTTTVRGIASELEVGRPEGLRAPSAASCDNLHTIPKERLGPRRAGALPRTRILELDSALRYALGIVY